MIKRYTNTLRTLSFSESCSVDQFLCFLCCGPWGAWRQEAAVHWDDWTSLYSYDTVQKKICLWCLQCENAQPLKSCMTHGRLNPLVSPSMGHWGKCPLVLQQFDISVHFRAAQSLTASSLYGCLSKYVVFCSYCSSVAATRT